LNYAACCFDAHLLATDPEIARRHIDKLLESDSEPFRSILTIRALYIGAWLDWNRGNAGTELLWALRAASAIEKCTASSLVAATDLILFPGLEREYFSQGGMNSALLFACRMESAEKVEQLLAAGADLNCCDLDGNTPLHHALMETDMALLLIHKGADVKAKSRNDGNMLCDAARYGGPELVRLFLEAGADVNHANPLAAAAEMGKLENVRCLVEACADINATGGSQGPALHAACSKHIEVVTYLLDNCADINLSNGRYGSALYANLAGIELPSAHVIFLLLLRRGARVDVEALMIAAMNLRVRELSKILLELDEGPRYSASNIRTALTAVRRLLDDPWKRDDKKFITRLLELRLGRKSAVEPDIRALTASIYEAECEWIGDSEWESDSEEESDCESDSGRDGASDSEGEDYSSKIRG
jgi:ankyrin repeat protein